MGNKSYKPIIKEEQSQIEPETEAVEGIIQKAMEKAKNTKE